MTIPDSKTIKYKRECQSNVIKTKKYFFLTSIQIGNIWCG